MVVSDSHLSGTRKLSASERDTLRRFTAVFSPLRKKDIPDKIVEFICEEQRRLDWRLDGVVPELFDFFPSSALQTNSKVCCPNPKLSFSSAEFLILACSLESSAF